ncbi:MAG: hypothetical protein Q8L48_10660 [Archangium sp.]|nr:hypothetical protein [Archangium sp.]
MRAITVVLVLVVSGCTPPPSGPTAIAWPKKTETSTEVLVYPVYDMGMAAGRTELTYAFGDDYPSEVELVPGSGTACRSELAPLTWTGIASTEGTAATATLVDGKLKLSLVEEGVVTLFLDGTIAQSCDGQPQVPLRHRLILTVQRIASFEVSHLGQVDDGCDTLVLPSGDKLRPPRVSALNAAGLPFLPSNASSPVELKLTSDSTVTLSGSWFTASPGHVTISLDTGIPVSGLESFDVVGPDSITEMTVELLVRKAISSSTFDFEPLVNGQTYRLPQLIPDATNNSVDVRPVRVVTRKGLLCAYAPPSWFDAVSSTPGVCPRDSSGEVASTRVPVLKIVDRGECRFKATVVQSTQQWSGNITIE